jgi:glycosyltransferase involved in cell wall biosynthesis
LKALFVVNSLCVGGAERQLVSLLTRMQVERFKVTLVCIKEGAALLDALSHAPCLTGGVHCLNVKRGLRWPAVRHLAQLIDESGADVLVCTNMYALLYGWLARRLCQRKDHVRLVEVFHTTMVGSRKEHWSMLLYRQLLRRIDLLVYVCDGQARHWRKRGLHSPREHVIHNGIDTKHFSDVWSDADKAALRAQYGLTTSDYLVGLCAVMRPEKAHGDLLLALSALKRSGLSIKCLLIGDGPERIRIEQQLPQLHLQGDVRITGMVDDVRPLIASCDVMVLSSHAVETFSMAALESMSLGKPMVMTDIGGASEQVTQDQHGLLYPAGDIEALAQCLHRLSAPARRLNMGASAAARVRRDFDISRMVSCYEQALTELNAKSARGP